MTNIIISFVVGIVVSVILFMVFIPYLHRLKFDKQSELRDQKNIIRKWNPNNGWNYNYSWVLNNLVGDYFVTKAFEIESLKIYFCFVSFHWLWFVRLFR